MATDSPRSTARRWWMTAETSSAAAAQLVVWIGLLAVSVFADMLQPALVWWGGMFAWTVGLVASTATLLTTTGLLPRVRRLPPLTPAATFSWILGTAAVGALAVTALVIFISTGSAAVLLIMLPISAAAVWMGARGFRSPEERG